jgi:hypothetical protein
VRPFCHSLSMTHAKVGGVTGLLDPLALGVEEIHPVHGPQVRVGGAHSHGDSPLGKAVAKEPKGVEVSGGGFREVLARGRAGGERGERRGPVEPPPHGPPPVPLRPLELLQRECGPGEPVTGGEQGSHRERSAGAVPAGDAVEGGGGEEDALPDAGSRGRAPEGVPQSVRKGHSHASHGQVLRREEEKLVSGGHGDGLEGDGLCPGSGGKRQEEESGQDRRKKAEGALAIRPTIASSECHLRSFRSPSVPGPVSTVPHVGFSALQFRRLGLLLPQASGGSARTPAKRMVPENLSRMTKRKGRSARKVNRSGMESRISTEVTPAASVPSSSTST